MGQFVISETARKYAPWSYSKAELAETCPFQFRHKYVLKTKGAAAPSDTRVGIVAHEVLERRVKGEPKPSAKKAAVEQNPLTTEEQEMLRTFDENMENFLQRFDRFCKTQKVTQIFTEVAWGFTDDYKPAEFFGKDVYFRGKLDLGALTPDGTLFLLDHKSGVAKDLAFDQKKRQQLQAYGVLAIPNLPDIAGVRGGIHFLQGDNPELRLQWVDFVPAERLRTVYARWLFSRINDCASNLTDEKFEARPATRKIRGWPCSWCSYQNACPSYQERFGGQEG